MGARNEIGGYSTYAKSMVRFFAWAFVWATTLALARFGPGLLWDMQLVALSWAAVALNLCVGVGWIVAFVRLIQAMDELDRKILQDAAVVAFGIGWIIGFAYVVAHEAGLVGVIELNVFAAVLILVFAIAYTIGRFRYL